MFLLKDKLLLFIKFSHLEPVCHDFLFISLYICCFRTEACHWHHLHRLMGLIHPCFAFFFLCSITSREHLCCPPGARCLVGLHSGEAKQFVSGWLRAYLLCLTDGPSPLLGSGSAAVHCSLLFLTELIIDTPWEKKHLH